MAAQFTTVHQLTSTSRSRMQTRLGIWALSLVRILPMFWPSPPRFVPIKLKSRGINGMPTEDLSHVASRLVSMMSSLHRMLRDLVMTRHVKTAPSAQTMGMTFSASVAPDIMVRVVNQSHPLVLIIHVKMVEHALPMGTTTNVNVRSCTLAPTVNTVVRRQQHTSMSQTTFPSSVKIASVNSSAPMAPRQTTNDQLFAFALVVNADGTHRKLAGQLRSSVRLQLLQETQRRRLRQ